MGKKLILGAVLGGLVYFVWGFASWMLPWHHATLGTFTDGEAVVSAIQANTEGRGVYVYPSMSMAQEEMEAKMARGPFLFVSVDDRGMTSMARPMGVSILIGVLSALVMTWLVLQTSGLGYGRRVIFVTVVGLVAGLLCYLPTWNWFGFATAYTLVSIADLVIGCFLAGLAIAWATR